MKKLIVLVVIAVVAVASPALAFQCPKLIAQINATVSNRFDAAAAQARIDSASAAKLHSEGKHADSVKSAQSTLAKLGVK